jgi:SsrA-binding protein
MKDQVVATNRKAFHEYTIVDKVEAGIALQGTEVKACRTGKVNLSDGWVDFTSGEAILREIHISPYSHGTYANHAEKRARKLLLHRREIIKLMDRVNQQGMTAVPLRVYFKGPWIKVELGLAKGKHQYDKRESKKEREVHRDIARAMRKG